jgi:hypothetical protein
LKQAGLLGGLGVLLAVIAPRVLLVKIFSAGMRALV